MALTLASVAKPLSTAAAFFAASIADIALEVSRFGTLVADESLSASLHVLTKLSKSPGVENSDSILRYAKERAYYALEKIGRIATPHKAELEYFNQQLNVLWKSYAARGSSLGEVQKGVGSAVQTFQHRFKDSGSHSRKTSLMLEIYRHIAMVEGASFILRYHRENLLRGK